MAYREYGKDDPRLADASTGTSIDNFATAKAYEEIRQRSEAAPVRTLFRTNGIPL
jgi:hypothetical protein